MHSAVDATVAAGVVLVSVTFDNPDPVPQRVRLRNRLAGPVLPPCRAGVPEPGWDDDGYEGVVPAESTIALGYACPTDAASTPPSDLDPDAVVTIDVLGREDERGDEPTSPTDAIRRLGPARPPADAVPAGEPLADAPANDDADTGANDGLDESPSARSESPSARSETSPEPPEPTDGDVAMAISETAVPTEEPISRPSSRSVRPASLAACERRIELAERLEGASVRTAAAALEDADATVESIESLDADRERLRRLAARATKLADRAADADPDIDALRRVA